jgi:hypothetical protein
MKKIIISLAALAAVSTAALAERSYDLRDSPEARGTFSTPADRALDGNINVNTLQSLDDTDNGGATILFGKYGTTTDPAELRRWDEKNGG